jgi:hypothetical protein
VLENGAEQKIATFEEITSDPHRMVASQEAERVQQLPWRARPSSRRITLIVLDLINTPFVAQAAMRARTCSSI